MHKYGLNWWAMACLQLLGFALAIQFGWYQEIISPDKTGITLLILGIHAISSLAIGWYTLRKQQPYSEVFWYVAETQLSLGMIGTLIGFIIMLNAAFGHIASADIESIRASIVTIGVGMGIAIRATLLGLISGVLIKAQLLNLEKSVESKQE